MSDRNVKLSKFFLGLKHHLHPEQNAEEEELPQIKRKALGLADMKPRPLESSAPVKINWAAPAKILKPEHRDQKPVIKDGLQFRNDVEHESYLNALFEKHGMFKELYEQYKVIYSSSANISGLERIWKHLESMGFSEQDAWLERADVYRRIGSMDLALPWLERNVHHYPKDPHANQVLALYYKHTHEYDLALVWMKKWERLSPNDPEVYYHIASIYHRMSSFDMARTRLLECLRIRPNHTLAKSLKEKIDSLM